MKKGIKSLVAVATATLLLAACGGNSSSSTESAKELYIFNTKSEIGDSFKTLAEDYEKETGVKVKTFSPGSGSDIRETMTAEMTSKNAPAIFASVNLLTWGPREGNYMFDLNTSDNEALKELANKVPENSRLSVDNMNLGLPYTIEGYGYVVNKKVLADLFAVTDVTEVLEALRTSSYDEFTKFIEATDAFIKETKSQTVTLSGKEFTLATEKTDLTKQLTGVFVFAGAEKWTYGNHLLNIPMNTIFSNPTEALYEPAEKFAESESALEKYIATLEFNTRFIAGENGPMARNTELINSTVGNYDNSLRLFGEHKGLFIQQGSWIYPSLAKEGVSDVDQLTILPIKMPFTDDEIKTGLTAAEFNSTIPTFVPNYFIINKNVSKDKIKLAEDFLVWLYTSERGLKFMKEEAGFIMFNDLDTSKSPNVLNHSLSEYTQRGRTLSNPFDSSPGNFKEFVGDTIKEEYLTLEKWDETTYNAFAKKLISKWNELKQN